MPDTGSLNQLAARLARAMSIDEPGERMPWVNPKPMHEAWMEVRAAFAGDGIVAPPQDQVLQTLRRFRAQGAAAGFSPRELKYVCHGVATPLDDSSRWSVLSDPPMLQRLLADVDAREREGATFRRCYQGLLGSYFAYGADQAGTPAEQGWNLLRGSLRERLPTVVTATRRKGQQPQWVQTLLEHRNLLDESGRCDRYARGFGRDGNAEFQLLCTTLGIQPTSWVYDEALLAWVRAVSAKEDAGFLRGLDDVLAVLNGDSAWSRLPERVSVEGTAISVRRYARCRQRPEHVPLRDACLGFIGNPWLDRASWDAWVQDEPARQMVDGWTKREYIRLFFEVLAQDGQSDPRRLQYWLQWADQTEDMWFIVGRATRSDGRREVRELLKQAASRCSELTGTTAHNNAFVMQIGRTLVVEFSQSGNACFVHDRHWPPVDLTRPSHDIRSLRGDTEEAPRLDRLLHVDRAGRRWEQDFDRAMFDHTGLRYGASRPSPATPPAAGRDTVGALGRDRPAATSARPTPGAATMPERGVASPVVSTASSPTARTQSRSRTISESDARRVKALCNDAGIAWKDHREAGGALWVLLSPESMAWGLHRGLFALLQETGFRPMSGKGYWISGE